MKNKKQSKSHIDRYETMYSADLVVANEYATIEELNKQFMSCDHKDLVDEPGCTAYCEKVIERKTNICYVLVRARNIKKNSRNSKLEECICISVHEAVHAALDIYSRIREEVSLTCQEPFAYFVEYLTISIFKTFMKK